MTAPAERILVVGVDGGGSKTRAVVADATGRTLATVDGPGSAVRPGEVLRSADVIAAVVRDALTALLASGFVTEPVPATDVPPLGAAIAAEDAAEDAASTEDGDEVRRDAPTAGASASSSDRAPVDATDDANLRAMEDVADSHATSDERATDDVGTEDVVTADVAAEEAASATLADGPADDADDADDANDANDANDDATDATTLRLVPAVLYVGVAGAGRESEREALRLALAARGLADEVLVVPDAEIALDDAFGEGPGVMLIAGTGSVAFARGPSGEFRRAGGWGPVIGDEGSGAWIGRRAINVAAASADGREPATALLDALLTAIDADDPAALIPWAAEATPARFAELAPVVLRVAANGDLRANTLLSMAIEELVLHVRTLARSLFVDERAAVPVALAGGLLAPRQPLRKRLEQRLRTAVPGAQLRQDEIQPARGAVRAALRQLGVEV